MFTRLFKVFLSLILLLPFVVKVEAKELTINIDKEKILKYVKEERKKELYQAIADEAIKQIGVCQDCTALATNSIYNATNIYYHDWPEGYASLGDWTDSPQAGDLCIYSGHISVYVGEGQAVHGGYDGNTVLSTVECSNTFIGYIHIDLEEELIEEFSDGIEAKCGNGACRGESASKE